MYITQYTLHFLFGSHAYKPAVAQTRPTGSNMSLVQAASANLITKASLLYCFYIQRGSQIRNRQMAGATYQVFIENLTQSLKVAPNSFTIKFTIQFLEDARTLKRIEVYQMTKKDVLEIRHRFSPATCSIGKICGCYVDGDRKKVAYIDSAFLSLPEEESFKYFDIFKKNLSGSIGKNLVTMPFPTESEFDDGTQSFLMKLRKSELRDPALVEEFYDKVIESYDYTGNYLILLIHDRYDIPGKTSDGITMDDASDEVYEYIMCSICHVNLSKAGLSYFDNDNTFHNRVRDWIVDMPDIGFLFPAFIDRSTDIHNVLYYTKNAEDLHFSFIDGILGTGAPVSAENQKETFQTIITETLGNDCDYEVVKSIHENLNEMITEQKDNPEPLTLSKTSIKRLLSESGVPEEKLEDFDTKFEDAARTVVPVKPVSNDASVPEPPAPKVTLYANNLANTRAFEVKTPDVVIKVNPDRTDLIETREIDGRKCIVIEINDEVTVNGIVVK